MKYPLALVLSLNALLIFAGPLGGLTQQRIVEGQTSLPLAYDVDVLVAGGSLAGWKPPCAASDKGASVLVIESRPYLGYDISPIKNYGSSLGKAANRHHQVDLRWQEATNSHESKGPFGPGIVKKKHSISDR